MSAIELTTTRREEDNATNKVGATATAPAPAKKFSLQQPIAFGLSLLATHMAIVTAGGARLLRARARTMRVAAECVRTAPPGTVESTDDVRRALAEATTIANTERICDEVRGLLGNRLSPHMKMAVQYKTPILAARALSRTLRCSVSRASAIFDAAHKSGLKPEDLPKAGLLPKPAARRLKLSAAESAGLRRLPDIASRVEPARARAFLAGLEFGGEAAVAGSVRREAARGTLECDVGELWVVVCPPAGGAPPAALAERFRETAEARFNDAATQSTGYVHLRVTDAPGGGALVEGLVLVPAGIDKEGKDAPARWQRLVVEYVPRRAAGVRLLVATGPPAHVEHLRAEARRRNLVLTETGVDKDKAPLLVAQDWHNCTKSGAPDDACVYRALGLAFVAPQDRTCGVPLEPHKKASRRKRVSSKRRRRKQPGDAGPVAAPAMSTT